MTEIINNNNKSKSCFGSLIEPTNSSNYLLNKKSKVLYNNALTKKIAKHKNYDYLSYQDYNLLKNGCKLSEPNNILPFNKGNLQINLITKMNLTCVSTLSSSIIYTKYIDNSVLPTSPTTTLPLIGYFNDVNNYPFWYLYNIDPKGSLFGVNNCSVNNFLKYMVLNKKNTNYTKYPETSLIENCVV
jgi:hypothetical protein